MGKWRAGTEFFCKRCKKWFHHRALHESSVMHNYGPSIRECLEDPSIPFTDIAQELGISRERVRQIAKSLGFIGKKRLEIVRKAVFNAQEQAVLNRNKRMAELKNVCQKKHIDFQLIPKLNLTGWEYKHALLNGYYCLVGDLMVLPIGRTAQDGHKNLYYHMCKSVAPIDFQVRKCKFGHWWVFPNDRIPTNVNFSPDPLPNYGTHSTRHDYENYKEAWYLLSV